MKKVALLISLFGFLLMTNGVFAQDHAKREKMEEMSPAQKAEKKTEKMTKDLNLSASQAEKIQAINLKHISANEKTKQEMKVLKERMKKEREAAKAEIDAVLTPEQREILKKQEAERAAKRKQNQGERGPKK